MERHWIGFICLLVLATRSPGGDEKQVHTHLFRSGKDGYPRFRIPALVATSKGTLLAFCEGRKGGKGLTGDIDIVLKRSSDSGKTWSPLEVALEGKGHTLGNPCPVVDQKDGTIWLAITRSHGQDTEEQIVAGKSKEATSVLVTFSKDDGKSWSPLRDISDTCRQPNWTWYGTGPGVGIQLKSGRLVVPSYHAEAKTKIYRSHMIYSDDNGKTWLLGDSVGEHCTECQIAERKNGDLVLISRTIKGKEAKTTALSKDGGKSWTNVTTDANLYDPSCQASLLRLKDAESPWLFCAPAGPGRRDLTVRLSNDEGRTWPVARLLRKGDSQYSSLALAPDGSICCLYDCWVDGNYQLFFTRLRLKDIK